MRDERKNEMEGKKAGPAPITRRRMLQGILACAWTGFGTLVAHAASVGHAVNLPAASDLARDGEASARAGVPLLLFFDRGDCPYCDRALRGFLVPMARGEEWGSRVLYRQIEVDDDRPLVNFEGARTTHRAFARAHDIRLTPTIILVDGAGVVLAPPLVGLMTPDFYGAYIEEAIATASARLKSAVPTPRSVRN